MENHNLKKHSRVKSCGTHFKTAVDESDVCAGELEPSLDLRDGGLHVGPGQGFGKGGKRKSQDKHLKMRGNVIFYIIYII